MFNVLKEALLSCLLLHMVFYLVSTISAQHLAFHSYYHMTGTTVKMCSNNGQGETVCYYRG